MDNNESKKCLFAIGEMIDNFLNSSPPILASTQDFLIDIQNVALGLDQEDDGPQKVNALYGDCIAISCDASIKKNPGGPSAIGFVINFNNRTQANIEMARFSRAKTNNQAEYDAVFFGLTTLLDLGVGVNITVPIMIYSDSLLVIDQLNGVKKCNDENLKHKRDMILELTDHFTSTSVIFSWKPRNSTTDLKLANDMAQNFLGVKNH